MAQINSYLTFGGNCREAMNFYQSCLGGELYFQTVGESPMVEQIPVQMRDKILHSTLTKGALVLMASDMTPQSGLHVGNAVSLMLECESEEQIRECYYKLTEGGQATHPLEESFWGALFGGLTDRYGNNWLLNFNRE